MTAAQGGWPPESAALPVNVTPRKHPLPDRVTDEQDDFAGRNNSDSMKNVTSRCGVRKEDPA